MPKKLTDKQLEQSLIRETHIAEGMLEDAKQSGGTTLEFPGNATALQEVEQSDDMGGLGVCEFCGQCMNVPADLETEAARNYNVAMQCKCSGAKEFQNRERRRKERERALADTSELIKEIFGENIMRFDVTEQYTASAILNAAAALVYDRKVINLTMNINYTTTAKISRNNKGNLVVERKDSSAEKQEVSTASGI